MSNVAAAVAVTGRSKRRGKIRRVNMSFQVSRKYAGCVDEAAEKLSNGNASEYMREAVLSRMIEDGIDVRAADLA